MLSRLASSVSRCLWSAGARGQAAAVQRRLLTSEAAAPAAVIAPATHVPADQGTGKDIEYPIFNMDGAEVGTTTLPGDLFDVPIRKDIVHRVVRWQRARMRQGTHKVKTRAEVNGSNRKPFPQKGTGRARQGTQRKAPHMRGGGVAHGPIPRSHAHDLNRKVRRLGLKCALSARAAERRLVVVDTLEGLEPRTRALVDSFGKILPDQRRGSVLIVDGDDRCGDGVWKASSNLKGVEVVPQIGINVYSILRHDNLLLTTDVLKTIENRLRAPIKR